MINRRDLSIGLMAAILLGGFVMARNTPTTGSQDVLQLVDKLESLSILSVESVSQALGKPFTRHEGNDVTTSYFLENQGLFSKVELRLSPKNPKGALLILELDPRTKVSLVKADKHFGGNQIFHPGSPHASPDVPTAYYEYKRTWGVLRLAFLNFDDNLVRGVALDRFEAGATSR